MKPAVLPFALALAAVGLAGMLARPVSIGDASTSALPDRHEVTIEIALDWTPAHEPGFQLAPGDTVKVLTVEQWRALEAFPTELQWWAARTAVCESNFDATQIGAAGEIGAWQIMPNFHGPVPSDLAGQARMAAALVAQHGPRIWSTAEGCASWSR